MAETLKHEIAGRERKVKTMRLAVVQINGYGVFTDDRGTLLSVDRDLLDRQAIVISHRHSIQWREPLSRVC